MNAYETITNEIIRQLEAGVIPWRQPWRNSTTGKLGASPLPHNHLNGKAYRGANLLMLMYAPYASRGWMTYKQAQSIGGQVRKGERGRAIVFWKFDRKDALTLDKKAPMMRTYTVFNVDQIDGLPISLPLDALDLANFEPLEEGRKVVDAFMSSASHPTLAHGGGSAFYRPSADHVQMPPREAFYSPHGYYSTLFHEFTHSTGHASRLDRQKLGKSYFGSESYSEEELVAELGAAFIAAECGISTAEQLDQSASYIKGWLSKLRDDARMVVLAAQRAQKAADFILGRSAAAREESEVAA